MAIFPAGESISIEEITEAKNYFCNYIGNFLKEHNILKKNTNILTNLGNLYINSNNSEKVKVI